MKSRKEESSQIGDVPLSLERYLDLACAAREQRERRLSQTADAPAGDAAPVAINQ